MNRSKYAFRTIYANVDTDNEKLEQRLNDLGEYGYSVVAVTNNTIILQKHYYV